MGRPGSTRTGRVLRYAAAALGLLVLGPILLAACGSVRAPSPGATGAVPAGASGSPAAASAGASPAQAALCQNTAAVTSLQIVRIHGIRVPEAQSAFPSQVTVASPARARAVARALCALPVMPRDTLHCPALFPGTSYQLRFTAGGRLLAVVTIQATGCDTVTGAGPVRRAISPGFWRVLATAAGLSPPGQAVFTGPACQPPPGAPTKINGCPALDQPGGAARPGGVAQPAG